MMACLIRHVRSSTSLWNELTNFEYISLWLYCLCLLLTCVWMNPSLMRPWPLDKFISYLDHDLEQERASTLLMPSILMVVTVFGKAPLSDSSCPPRQCVLYSGSPVYICLSLTISQPLTSEFLSVQITHSHMHTQFLHDARWGFQESIIRCDRVIRLLGIKKLTWLPQRMFIYDMLTGTGCLLFTSYPPGSIFCPIAARSWGK